MVDVLRSAFDQRRSWSAPSSTITRALLCWAMWCTWFWLNVG
ncbi:hypothetical protein ACWDKQ_19135 [Saccharopolyspora sp. NPDC000995]